MTHWKMKKKSIFFYIRGPEANSRLKKINLGSMPSFWAIQKFEILTGSWLEMDLKMFWKWSKLWITHECVGEMKKIKIVDVCSRQCATFDRWTAVQSCGSFLNHVVNRGPSIRRCVMTWQQPNIVILSNCPRIIT